MVVDKSLTPKPDDPDMPLVSRLLYQLIDEKYKTLLDESSDLMCITDREGKFIYVNKKLADSLGFTKKEMLGMHMNDILCEESQREFAEKAKEFLKDGKTKISNFAIKTKFGGRIVGEMNSIAFYDNLGKCCGAKAVFKDQAAFVQGQDRNVLPPKVRGERMIVFQAQHPHRDMTTDEIAAQVAEERRGAAEPQIAAHQGQAPRRGIRINLNHARAYEELTPNASPSCNLRRVALAADGQGV